MNRDINVAVGGPINAEYSKVYQTKFLKPGIPFALQVTEPNTKYVIKHNFEIKDDTVVIPENCILEFDGGSINSAYPISLSSGCSIINGIIKRVDNAHDILVLDSVSNVIIDGLVIDGNKENHTAEESDYRFSGISISGCSDIKIRKCTIKDTLNAEDAGGIIKGAVAVVGSSRITIDSCTFTDNDRSCIFYSESDSCSVVDSSFTDNLGSAVTGACTNLLVSGCYCKDNGDPGEGKEGLYSTISLNADNSVISNNTVINAGGACINIAHTEPIKNVVVSNNILINAKLGCVYVSNASDVVISGNTITNTLKTSNAYCIMLNDGDGDEYVGGVSIIGNTITCESEDDVPFAAIRLSSNHDVSIDNNILNADGVVIRSTSEKDVILRNNNFLNGYQATLILSSKVIAIGNYFSSNLTLAFQNLKTYSMFNVFGCQVAFQQDTIDNAFSMFCEYANDNYNYDIISRLNLLNGKGINFAEPIMLPASGTLATTVNGQMWKVGGKVAFKHLGNLTNVDGTPYNNYGTFAAKPIYDSVSFIGTKYFCTDRYTEEGGSSNPGIEIILKSVDITDPDNPVNVWVDALGRVVS